MIVMKFGGTSVEDAIALENVCTIISERRDRNPLVVLSACAGVTNALLSIARAATEGSEENARAQLALLRNRHIEIATRLLSQTRNSVVDALIIQFKELEQLVSSVATGCMLLPRALDQVAAHGERWSSLLLVHSLMERGIGACWVDARDVMITSDEFTRATPLFDLIETRAREKFLPYLQQGTVIVTQGFIGATRDGITTTIGRGGSDYSAAIFGSALDAEEIQIWTDVDGILTADPSILPQACRIKEMTFDEAAELAYFGAKVLHPSTILPAVKKNIPVRVLNSKRPEGEGTLITERPSSSSHCIVKSVAYKENISVITIKSTRMLMNHGFLALVFEVFARNKKSIDVVATSEVGVSLTVDNELQVDQIVAELQQFAEVRVDHGRAVVSVVGEKMKQTRGIAGRVFTTLSNAGVNVELISHGGSEINLTFVIREAEIESAVRSLHEEFFLDAPYENVFERSEQEV